MNSHLKRVLILLLIFTFVFQMAGVTSLSRVQAYADTETEEALDVPDADEAEDVTTEETDTESPGEIETDGENPPDAAAEEPADPEASSEETAEVPEEVTEVSEETAEISEEPTEEFPVVEETVTVNDTAKAEKAEKTGTVLAFTSDAHNRSGNVVGTRIETWIDNVENKHGDIDVMAFGGDMGVASFSSGSEYWTYAQADMTAVSNKGVTGVYTTGNHEYSMGGDFKYNSYTGNSYSATETKGQFKINTEGAEGNDYRIYCLGSVSDSNSYTNQVSALENYLGDVGNSKPIFIITHFPLHKFGSRKTTGAKSIIDVLNAAVERGQTIVFLWGHNHTESDTYYDQIYGPGTVLPTNDGNQTIQFYYGAAGCMSDSENGTGSGYVKGKGLVVTITPKRGNTTMNFTYYNEAGTDVTETSSDSIRSVEITATSETILVTNVILDQETATVEAGKTVKLTATVEPEDANSGLTWTSSNESVATVKNGTVTGVAEGTATITVASTEDNSIKDTCVVTVTAATEPVVGGTVNITPASSNSPEESVKINVGETLVVNVTNGSSSSTYNFTASLSKSGVAQIQGNSTVNIAAGGTGQFTFEGIADGTVDITIQNSSSYGSQYVRKGTIHLTVGAGGGDNPTPTGKTVDVTPATTTDEKSITIDVDETFTINVNNASTRSGYDFTATLSKTGVAEIQGSDSVHVDAGGTGQFTVKGLANGTVDINISNNNSSSERKAVIHVTVGEGGGDRYVPTTFFTADKDYLIAVDKGNGKVDVLKNAGSGSLGSVELTVGSENGTDYITTADTSVVWKYTTNTRNRVSNSSRYLTINSSSKVLETDTSGNYAITYNSDSKIELTYPGSSSGNIYYVAYSNGTFSATTANAASSAATIKLFVKDDGTTVSVTGVTLDKSTLSLEAGQTDTLTATVAPENATNKSVTWSTSDDSVATVSNGTVTAVAAGTATITVTTVDGSKTATCTVTVTEPEPGEGVTYYLADTLEADGEYIIANGNTGAVYVVSNTSTGSGTSTGLVGISANVVNDSITLNASDAAKATFTTELKTSTSGAISAWLKLGDNYLYTASSGGLRISNEQTSSSNTGKFWHYKADGKDLLWYFKDTSSSDGYTDTSSTYKYYLNCSSTGTFTSAYVSSTSLANTNTPAIYLFKKATQKVDVTGVTLDKTNLSLEEGQTGTLTATVAPPDATNKAVSWDSSDETVATVSNGTVTAVEAGTATITVTTVDGGKTATCTVTVTASPKVTFVLTDTFEEGGEYIIANGKNGSVYIVSDTSTGSGTSTGLVGISANVVGDSISLSASDAAKAVFTAEMKSSQSGAVSAWLKHDGKYLYTASSGGLRISDEQTTNSGNTNNTGKFWHYKADGKDLLWYFKDTSSSDGYTDTSNTYKYYLNCSSSGTFTSGSTSSTSLENSTTPAIYLFVKDDGSVKYNVTLPEGFDGASTVKEGKSYTFTKSADADEYNYGDVTYTMGGGASTPITPDENGVYTIANVTGDLVISGTRTPKPATTYVLTDTLQAGKNYIIANKNTGEAYALTNNSGSVGATAVNIVDDKITTSNKAIVFAAEGSSTNVTDLQNKGSYLTVSNSSSTPLLYNSTAQNRAWTYSSDLLSCTRSSSSTTQYYVYYSTNNNNYSSSSTKTSSTSPREIYLFVEDEGTTPHEHTYGTPEYNWAEVEGGYTCTATAICSGCDEGTEGHSVTETVTATYAETTAATCTAAGVGTYTATFTNVLFEQKTKTVEIPKVAHTLEAHPAVPATCTAAGNSAYWECSVCGKYFSDADATTEIEENSWVISATGHDYGQPVWTWAEDHSTASAKFKCTKCGDEQTVDATVSAEPGTGENLGKTVYTASVTFNNNTYTDVQTEDIELTVTFVTNCDTSVDPQTVQYGGLAQSPTGLTKTGHYLVGWYTSSTFEGEKYSFSTPVTSDITLYAKWNKNIYEVTFDNQGHGTKPYTNLVEYNDKVSEPEALTEQGYEFGGWYLEAECENLYDFDTPVTGNFTLYAKWTVNQYTLTFLANEGDTEPFATITQNYGTEVTAPAAPTKAFYTFNGWNAEVPATMPAENKTFTATWTAKDAYYLIGSMTNWTVVEANEFTANPDNPAEYSVAATLTASDEIKVVRAVGGVKQEADYYPSTEHPGNNGQTGNYTVDQYHAGNVTVYFRPGGNSDPGWQDFGGYFYIEGDHAITVETSPENTGTAQVIRGDGTEAATSAPKGMALTVNVVPADNYQLDKIEIWKTNGGTAAEQTLEGNTFNMPDYDVTVKVYFKVITWSFVDFTWEETADGYKATANYRGDNGSTKTVAATVTFVTTDPTCETAGKTVYTATVTATASLDGEAKEDTKEVTIPANGHTYGNLITEEPATCEADGVKAHYECSVCHRLFDADKVETTAAALKIPATGHDWNVPTYVWADDNTSVTATRTCKNDASHVETETATTTGTVTTPATCTQDGEKTWTSAAFTNTAFTAQTKTEVIPANGHTYGELIAEKAATCTEDGVKAHYECSVCHTLFDADKVETTAAALKIPATGHDWNEPTYVWAADNTSVTATRTCKNDQAHVETETATATGTVTTPATCTQAGEKTWTSAAFSNTAFTAQTKTEAITASGHTYGELIAEEVATCTADGVKAHYECSVCHTLFDADKVETTAEALKIPATGHDWNVPTYVWADDNTSVTATRTCKNNPAHNETDTAVATSEVTKAATCTEAGVRTWTSAAFSNTAFTAQTKTEAIPAKGHTLTETAATAATCTEPGNTAYWTCSECHKYFRDAAGTSEIEADSWIIPAKGHTPQTVAGTPATCTEPGLTDGSVCSVCHVVLEAQDTIPATGHSWNFPTYEWAADYSSVTATRTCKNDAAHQETETVGASYGVVTPATEQQAGLGRYTSAAFTNTAFTIQSIDVEIPPTGFRVTYVWADDFSSVTATAIPYAQGAETITETVTPQYSVKTAATCTDRGIGLWTATFTKSQFATQTKEVEIPAAGHTMTHHDAVPATCTVAGTVEYYSCSVCSKNFSDEAGMNELTTIVDPAKGHTPAAAVHENEVAATCEVAGHYDSVIYCSVCDAEISRTPVTVDALGHDWNEPTYEWAADNTSVTATRTCKRDATHNETETVSASYDVVTPATEEEAGLGRYTSAAFTNTEFTVQTKDVVIPATGFEVSYVWAEDFSGVTATAVPYAQGAETITETVTPQYSVKTEATCTAAGTGLWTATFTNSQFTTQTKEVEIPAKGHSLIHHAAAAAACGVAGNIEYWQCETCGKLFADEAATQEKTESEILIPALSHNYEAKVTKEPTCEEEGVRTYTCSLCGDTYTEVIPAAGHDWGEVQYAWSSDNSKVTAKRTCATDPAHVETETVDTTSEVLVQVTCETDGKVRYTTAEFTNKDFEVQKMEVVVKAEGHKAGDPVHENEKEATCTSGGYYDEVVYCTECGKELSRVHKTVDALGHDFSEWTVTKAPTCTEKGEEESTCSRCTAKNTRELAALGHSWDAGKVTKEPTYRTDGEMTYTCTVCGATYTEPIPKQGWKRDSDNNWNYINPDGTKATGWKQVGDYWYYMDKAGVMQTGWTKVGNKWYYMNKNGAMQTGWQKIGGKWYYFASSGAMLTGWQEIGGKTYYFKSSGVMADKEWVSGYWWINAGGTWTYKYRASWEKTSDGHWMFKATNGWTAKSVTYIINDVSYTFDANGYML